MIAGKSAGRWKECMVHSLGKRPIILILLSSLTFWCAPEKTKIDMDAKIDKNFSLYTCFETN